MVSIQRLLSQDHILLDLDVTSKKRLFEQIGILFENHHQISRSQVFDALFNREKLGSTGLGHGFALPHGRLKGLRDTLCAFIRISGEIPFDSPDGQNVKMAFALLVPEHANEQHLHLLSEIAEMFNDSGLRQALLEATDPAKAWEILNQWTPNARR
ncbi:MAG: PTS sugar transporter subunit IIA, partial [Betaproteobacteria bacterium]|nr:PTS sugar transporter subunit IIA [Betaproteobacteria bacterium]MDE1982826.1 PTS sugar transporter subunit IIA [Betaproteobacteria bacterium]